jgi:hypothetical protein
MLKIKPIEARDRARIYEMLQQEGRCTAGELESTLHKIDLKLFNAHQSLYMVIKGENEKYELMGYAVYGADPNAASTFHVYDLARSPVLNNDDILSQLLTFIENDVVKKKGRIIISEVSSNIRDSYHYQVYLKQNFHLTSEIKNFYSEGEHKLILSKNLNYK